MSFLNNQDVKVIIFHLNTRITPVGYPKNKSLDENRKYVYFPNTLRKKDFVVLTMKIAVNQREEQRLCYRWPVRFARSVKEKPIPGQIVDVSSWNLSFLCHANKKCPSPEQLITVDFGVPYFDSVDSFDTVFFNRIGRVSRVDNLTNLVTRVVIQFSRPLFFRPGEQNISESDALQRLDAKTQSISKAEEGARLYSEALTQAEEKTTSHEQAKTTAEKKLKDAIKARCKAEATLRAETEEKERAEEKARIQALATAKARAKAESEAKARIEAESRAEAEIQARIEAQKQAKFDIEEITKARDEELIRAEERIKSYAEAKDRIEEKLRAEIEARCKIEANAICQAEQSAKAQTKAATEAELRIQAQKKAEDYAHKKAIFEEQMQQMIKSHNGQIAKIKAETAEEIAKAKADTADAISKLKIQLKQNTQSHTRANIETEQKTTFTTIHSPKTTLVEKVDKLIKDKGTIF